MKGISFELRPGEIPVLFRFNFKGAREMERVAGCNYQTLLERRQQVEAISLMTCYGLRHDEPTMTVDKAVDLIDAYIEKGGNIVQLYEALQTAMNHSGIYGPAPKDDEKSADRPSPAPAAVA